MTQEIFITIGEGECKEQTLLKRFFKTLPNGRGVLKFESKQKHSSNQRCYYFGVIVPHILLLLRDMGYNEFRTKEDAHLFCKYKFAPIEILDIDTGAITKVPGSTKKMTKERYRQFIDDILMFAAEHSYMIPEPPNTEEKYLKAV